MDNRAEVREFLVSRRAKVSPEQVGLPAGPNRRVPGLRRGDAEREHLFNLARGGRHERARPAPA